MSDPLRKVTETVIERARTTGYTVSSEVRDELARAGLDEELWKDVLALARSSLRYDGEKYWYQAPRSARVIREQGRLDAVGEVIRAIIEQQRARPDERREQERVELIQPVTLMLEDGSPHHVVTRDLSVSGVRLLGTRQLLGQKVRLLLPHAEDTSPYLFQVRILWTCAVGDNLFENGGSFVGMES